MRFIKFIVKLWLVVMAATAGAALLARQKLRRIDHPEAEQISVVSIFDGTDLRSTASGFRGGEVWSVFGGTRLDLRRAEIQGAAHLSVTTAFGGTDITVPDSWVVTVDGPVLAGGVEQDTTDPSDVGPDAPRLIITSRTVFGGLRVVSRPVLKAAEET